MPMTLSKDAVFISNEEVMNVSSMDHYIRIVEHAYKNYGNQKTFNFQRQSLWVPDRGSQTKSIKLMASATPSDDVLGTYTYSGGYKHKRGWQKCFILFNFSRGNIIAIIESEYMSRLKTGAVSAVAAKYLSRKDAQTVGIFGAGRQAVTQLDGLCKIRKIKKILVHSRTDIARYEFCSNMSEYLGINVVPASTPQEIVENSDIIVTATTSKNPVFDGRRLNIGTHITAIGAHYPERRELDAHTMRNKKIVVDTMDSFEECGEFLLAGLTSKDIHADLGAVAAGKKPGRENPEEITVFKSGGRGIEYLALANFVYRQLKKT